MSQKDDIRRALVLYGDESPDTLYYMSSADTPAAVNSPQSRSTGVNIEYIHENASRGAPPNPFLCHHEQPIPAQPAPVQQIHVHHTHQNKPASTETAPMLCQCCAGAGTKKDKKKKKMNPILKGVAILVVSPFAMVGAGIVVVGSVVYATGYLVMGVGDVLTGGPLKGVATKAWKNRKNRD